MNRFFSLKNVATRKFKMTWVACIIFLPDSEALGALTGTVLEPLKQPSEVGTTLPVFRGVAIERSLEHY